MTTTARPTPLVTTIVLMNGLVFIGIGAAFIIAPTEMAAIVEIDASTTLARNDLRAIYGGLELGLGVALLGSLRTGKVDSALRALLLIFAAMILARLISITEDGPPDSLGLLLMALETSALASAGFGLSLHTRRR